MSKKKKKGKEVTSHPKYLQNEWHLHKKRKRKKYSHYQSLREQEKLPWLLFNKFLELLEGKKKRKKEYPPTYHSEIQA